MGVTIATDVWEPNQALYVFILVSCSLSIFCLPQLSSNSNRTLARTPFDHFLPSSLFRFRRSFLLLYSLSSVMEGLWSVFGEYELSYYGVGREQMVLSLCVGYAAALFLGTFLGMLSDLIGQKKVCLIFCMLHLFVGVWKRIIAHPSVWLASICLSLASSIFSFSFETWMVVEHDKLVYRQDTLNDLFWLMTFTESASFISSQVIANSLVGSYVDKTMLSASTAAVFLAILSITQGWKKDLRTASLKDYRISFNAHIFGDKRVWLLAWAQACVQFSIAVFWILWAPTIVADGREVHLGLIYPCLLGARMLGSTAFPWFFSGMLSIQPEDCLVYVFIVMGFVLSVVAYDYQEIGVLVALFCLFHACVGLILPSLARLRTMYIPNNLRGGMISLSHSPANAAILFFLLQDKKLPEESIHDFAHDLVKALQFLHSKGIIYCDLKPSNILLDENGRTKLCDFGLSRKLSDISKTPSSLLPQAKRGTPFYMAPELFQDGGVHSYASDLWALGCVLYECYAGNPPFIGKEFTRLVKSILSDPTPSLPGTPSRPFVNLINSLLIKDPAERIQWTELCEHAFWRTKFTPLPLPPQPAFTDMIELLSKPYLSERNSDNPPQNKTPPKYREKDSKGGPKQDENCIVGSRGYVTPVKGVSSGRKIQMKASGKVVEEKQKDPSSNTRDVNLLRLSRMAKSNLQRENEKENYRRPLPNGSENDAEVKIENTDMELDFDENTEDETNDDPDGSDNPTCPEEKMSTQNQHEGKLEQMDNNNNTNQLDASPMINTPVSDDTRAPDLDLSSEHNEMGPTPPTVSPQLKRVKEGSEYALDSDTSKSSNDLTQVLWHPSDLSVRPVMPSRKADKMSIPSLPIDALPATDYVKMPKDQVDTFNNRIITILKGNTAIGEKQNVIRYLEMLSSNADAANILTNGSIMLVVVKMLRQSKASALRVQLASLIGLLIRHSTFIDDELANSGILGSLTDGLRDKQEKVRRFSMAALGELLFYISTQNEHNKDNNPPESPPSKDSRFSSGWQVSNPLISLVSSILRKGEDDVTQLYALRTIENICSQGGYWAARFTSQDVITNLCYIFRAAGKQESMRLTAGSCLVRLVRFNPPSIQQVMDKLPFRDTVSAFVKGSPREQQICLNLLNMAMIGSHMFTNIGRHLPLVEEKNLVPCLVALIEQGSEVLRGKALVFVALLCKHGKRWLPHFFCNAKLLSAVDRLAKEKDSYIQQCLDAFVHVVASTIPGLLEAITGDIQQMMGGRRPGHIAALNSRATPKTNFHLFPVIYQILVSSSFKRRVVTNQVLQQLANLIKLAESPFQGRDDFQITLLRVLESITEEPSVILESPNIFIREILPSLAVVYKGNKDWDARFLCLKIMFDVMVIFLNEPTEDEEQSLALKSISNTHFLPLYPTLIEDEDPIPMYAQKLLVMLIEFNYIKIPDILHLKIISQCFEFLLGGDLSTANVNNVMLCLALASAPELESKILSQLKVVRRIGNLLELVYAKEMEDFIEPTLGLCRAFLLRSINNRKGFIYARINRKGFIYARIEVIVSELKSSSTPGVSDAAFIVALELQRLPRCI